MKKLLSLLLGVLVIVVGFFAFSIFYSKSKVDLFFSANNGTLYNKSGVIWKLNDFESKIFNGKYVTELLVLGEKIAVFEHKAKFGLKNFNIFNIGSVETTIKIYNKDFSFSSDIKFSGIDTKIDVKENSTVQDEFFVFYWKDIKANHFVSFERDVIDFNADIPYFSVTTNTDEENTSLVLENQKYTSHTSKRNVGLWLGDTLVKIGKISIMSSNKKTNYYYDDYDYYEDNNDSYEDDDTLDNNDDTVKNNESMIEIEIVNNNAVLSDISMLFNIKSGDNSTIVSNNKMSLKNFILDTDDTNLTLDDIVFDISLQNIDLDSMKKITNSLDNVDFQDNRQVMLLGVSLVEYAPAILAKHPKIVLNELSAKHRNQTSKIDGFIQYVGNGDLQSLGTNIKNDLYVRFNISIAEVSIKEILHKNLEGSYYYEIEDIEKLLDERLEEFKELGFEIKNGEIKGNIEYKNGALLVNGKPSVLLEVLLGSLML